MSEKQKNVLGEDLEECLKGPTLYQQKLLNDVQQITL